MKEAFSNSYRYAGYYQDSESNLYYLQSRYYNARTARFLSEDNQKGGVAKTTTTINVGIGLARLGKKVLIIDNAPQGSLIEVLRYQQPDELDVTLSNIMEWVLNEEDFDLDAGILHHKEDVDLMPANIELAGVETSLIGIMSSETVLKDYIEMIGDRYDYIVIDCSPNLGQLTLNALVAADEIIIPVNLRICQLRAYNSYIRQSVG